MPLISLLILVALVGVIAWAIITYLPMAQGFKTLITIIAIVACVVLVLNAFGLMPDIMGIRVGN